MTKPKISKKTKKTESFSNLDLASLHSKFSREVIEKVVFQGKINEVGWALMMLWSAVEDIIKHLEENK